MKSPTHRKASRRGEVRARLMWEVGHRRGGTTILHTPGSPDDKPVFVLPADQASVERMREQVAVALANWSRKKADLSQIKDLSGYHPLDANKLRLDARAVLTSLNLTPTSP